MYAGEFGLLTVRARESSVACESTGELSRGAVRDHDAKEAYRAGVGRDVRDELWYITRDHLFVNISFDFNSIGSSRWFC